MTTTRSGVHLGTYTTTTATSPYGPILKPVERGELKFCPLCHDAGKRSEVYPGAATTTLLGGGGIYYDENGVKRTREMNTTTQHYSCSRGHVWREQYRSA